MAERVPTHVRSRLSDFVEETQGPRGQLRIGTEGSSQGHWRLKQDRQGQDLEAPPAWGEPAALQGRHFELCFLYS